MSSNLIRYIQSAVRHRQVQSNDSSIRRVQNRAARRAQAQAGRGRGAVEGEEGWWVRESVSLVRVSLWLFVALSIARKVVVRERRRGE